MAFDLRFACAALLLLAGKFATAQAFRPPATPLVTSDPFLSIWSENDRLTDGPTRHWTRRPHALESLVKVDGSWYRIMGDGSPADALPQRSLTVTPTRTIYRFGNAKVEVSLTFMTPALPDDLDVYARPVTYLTWAVRSADGKRHNVEIEFLADTAICMNEPYKPVSVNVEKFGGLAATKFGLKDQTLLRPAGDDSRINWGYGYVAARIDRSKPLAQTVWVDTAGPMVKVGMSFDLGKVGTKPATRQAMIGYDELYSIEYFGQKLRPYWRRNGMTPEALFTQAAKDYPKLAKRCEAFDSQLMADAAKVGGAKYAQIVALSYRECVAANGLAADAHGQPLLFTKENTSNGDIATVDVIFPMDPIWILLSPSLAKASLVSNFAYAASPHWKFPNAPHDLGTYPLVFGRDDGGEGMPVEESGNMIILTDAIAHAEGNARFAAKWWPQLTQWAKYLEKYGLDPENQLCTDDFMGHLAHNANLSVKAILALGAYGDLCKMRGDAATGNRYLRMAREDARHWMKVADAGDHSLLAFDKPNTWSQKYNLVWDSILGLNAFPPSVAQ
ncbi:MAG TPA: DUF4965 domain-containing protein, partial [Fimbriimonadaceae bacterium]|nr:DUF4965 domain-containing protein [Fimbriimonadaceae bacterium]